MRSTKNNSTVSLITAASMILGLAAVEETARTQAAHAATTSSARLLAQTVDGKQGIPLTSTTVANIAEKVAPAIVNIEVNQPFMTGNISGFPFGNIPDGFDFFFNGQRMNPRGGGGSQARPNMPERHNTGTGFIVREDGYIVTNAHVVKNSSKINVTLNDKRQFIATTVGIDTFSDLAVLKIAATGLPTAEMGTSTTLRPGEFVIAIGSPMGYDHSVTLGIVSAVGRTVTDVNGNINFIQTDAAINPGNSGGPLLNLVGQVVGVNTAIAARAQNIGFSIPIDIAKPTVTDLIANKKIERPFLGLKVGELTESVLQGLGLPKSTLGVFISQVFNNGSAAKSGIERMDIVQKIDGKDIRTAQQLQDAVRARKVGETLSFMILRNKAAKAITVTIGSYPSEPASHQEKSAPKSDSSGGEHGDDE
ncbi:MAG: trypsin-like peptidase domain-containing protein [Candidatus Melainabacteria bacterium]|jgi:serine protease Do|nr:trypsin-like peptidase domain-containing protein [Candidatus Melainabacteria bacterium]